MKFTVVRTLNKESWHKFLIEHPNANIFHTPEMFEALNRAHGYQSTLWATVNDQGTILALFIPVQITLKKGILSHFTTRSVVYGSVLCSPRDEGERALDYLLRDYLNQDNHNSLFTELRNLCDLTTVLPVLDKWGFVYEGHLNYLNYLNCPLDKIMSNLSRSTRQKISRELRRDRVSISEINKRNQLTEWYTLLQKTYAVAKVSLAGISLFEAAFDILYPRGMIKFLLARVDGIGAACSVELIYKDAIYGWYGGMDRNFSYYHPTEMLTWHILKWGVENGYRVYDFGGAGKPDEEYGVRDFKAKFGGTLVNYGRNIRIHHPLRLKLSKSGYAVYRRFL
ncbi:MAG: GNAT family N-acetyltransferase [Candidatus Scalindua sp. AMX11]|nr:MAG: GNAT family N-acetyltransferase [Candidatus Scalindua sp.]NOG82988.1 GNAT family N-acetyltransferase [Planctomycetota bacterium]RZV68038.1 MAG: GNAT family N-acetyltransferase [Candidatus Scalindua sp. SCAELEC01]TDE63729.1 MAG: GNAT family N-acetyltransferase [Candidatus Scalindua sp. AMX11]GJQ60485.1 MAG: hypothetical protein SCALA701_32860 [Candidatus Scalindua sp.]